MNVFGKSVQIDISHIQIMSEWYDSLMYKSFHITPMTQEVDIVKTYLLNLQNTICDGIEKCDGKARFIEDEWQRNGDGGGGKTRVMAHGDIFEQAGVNFSLVHGETLPPSATANRPELAGKPFTALGVSLVIHPHNPFVPTSHANFRFFTTVEETPTAWFGGGYDLTPYYGFKEDCIHWHKTAHDACAPFGEHIYPHFKKWCDEYFYLPHRKEPRGVGGLFFDDFFEGGFHASFDLVKNLGDSYLNAYLPIVEKRKAMSFTEEEKSFQKYRRGRYVEFNLVYDRGTLFGLQSGGRTESILMSLPPEVSYRYNWQPKPNTPEATLYTEFLTQRDWLR